MARKYNTASVMRSYVRISVLLGALALTGITTVGALVAGGYYYVAPSLPLAEELRDVALQIPLSVYSRDGRLIAQFGEKRSPVPYEDMPPVMVRAVLAAEDDRFFEHPGIDYQGTMRAIFNFVANAGDSGQGGSTITQQIARQYFLSRDKTLVRKFKEWIVAIRIEREFSKQEILDIFLNTTFFGHHAHGVAAAAQTYFGKDLSEIGLSDAAIIAGIPQGPSILNPISSPAAAMQRRSYVLRRMRELEFISADEYQAALEVPVDGTQYGPQQELDAPYVAEMVRAELIRRFGPAAYVAGLKVTTTVDSRLQEAADTALRDALITYSERHGYRGPYASAQLESEPLEGPGDGDAVLEDPGVEASGAQASVPGEHPTHEQKWDALLAEYAPVAGFKTGLVIRVDEIPPTEEELQLLAAEAELAASLAAELGEEVVPEEPQALVPVFQAQVYFSDYGLVPVDLEAVSWAAPYITDNRTGDAPQSVADVLAPGDVVQFRQLEDGALRLAQVPEVQGAIVSLDPLDGGIAALSGGFDFFLSNYNRATQSKRQPGSAFKPFVYSAALESGFTAATIVNDAPIVEPSAELERVWRPENYSGSFNGPTRLREALIKSLNLVSIRVIQRSGLRHTVEHMRGFGFDETALPMNPTLALGAGGVSPLDLVGGYAAFSNGGYRVEPYLIDRIEDADGDVLYTAAAKLSCRDCEETPEDAVLESALIAGPQELYGHRRQAPRAVSAQNAYLMNDMMQDVVRRGTGVRAYRELRRTDLRGKTGTTNDRRDTWFAGFNGDVVAAAWVGFDQERSLGNAEEGARTALPMWIDFMREALDGVPLHAMARPPGIVDVRINPDSGLVARARDGSVFEKFRMGHVPEAEATRPEVPLGPLLGDPTLEEETAGPGSIF